MAPRGAIGSRRGCRYWCHLGEQREQREQNREPKAREVHRSDRNHRRSRATAARGVTGPFRSAGPTSSRGPTGPQGQTGPTRRRHRVRVALPAQWPHRPAGAVRRARPDWGSRLDGREQLVDPFVADRRSKAARSSRFYVAAETRQYEVRDVSRRSRPPNRSSTRAAGRSSCGSRPRRAAPRLSSGWIRPSSDPAASSSCPRRDGPDWTAVDVDPARRSGINRPRRVRACHLRPRDRPSLLCTASAGTALSTTDRSAGIPGGRNRASAAPA